MNKSQISYLSSDGKTTVRAVVFLPEQKPPRGIVQISHGMCEHMERYTDFAGFLCGHGLIVCGNDHLGHGKTAAIPENLGFFAEKNGDDLLVEDVAKLTDIMQENYPGLPCFLLGHSMGSFIARLYLSKYASKLTAAILSGTGGPNPLTKFAVRLAQREMRTKGMRTRSATLHQLAFGSYNKRIKNAGKSDWLSRDPAIVNRYNDDPYCNFIFTASAFHDLFHMLDRVSSSAWAKSVPKGLPILLLSGQADPVGGYGKGVSSIYRRLKAAGVSDLSLKLYPQGRHEMINETNRNEVYADILSYIEKKLS